MLQIVKVSKDQVSTNNKQKGNYIKTHPPTVLFMTVHNLRDTQRIKFEFKKKGNLNLTEKKC